MSKAKTALEFFEPYNCAQSVFAAHATDYGLGKDKALSISVGFGGGMGRLQETCGAVTGALMILGLKSDFKEADSRPKINEVYAKVLSFIDDFTKAKGSIKCRDILGGCDLRSEEGQKYFKEHKLKDKCRECVTLCCELLEKY